MTKLKILKLWSLLSDLGVNLTHHAPYAKRIKVSNQIGIGFFIIAWPFVVFFSLLELYQQSMGVMILIGFWSATPLLNHFKMHSLARFNLILVLNVSVFIYSYWLGTRTGIPLVCFAALLLPFILYEFHDHFNKIIGSVLTLCNACFLLSPWNHLTSSWGVEKPLQLQIANFMIPYVCLVLLVIIYSWYRQNANTEKDLAHHISELEEASNHKDAFLANISHEIRTPMNGIIGMNQLISETALDSEQKELSHDIAVASETMMSLINDILDFSKIQSGKMSIDPHQYDPHELIHSVATVVKSRIISKEVEFFVEVDPNIPHRVYGDSLRLKQILLNLLGNAAKFTLRGFVKLKVTLHSEISESVKLGIDVIDTGIGISSEKLLDIFESFKQADSSTSRNYGGTGLGLSISKELIHLMGGQIYVNSQLNEGSTFGVIVLLRPLLDAPSVDEKVYPSYSKLIFVEENKRTWGEYRDIFPGSRQVENISHINLQEPFEYLVIPSWMSHQQEVNFQLKELQQSPPEFKLIVALGPQEHLKSLSKLDLGKIETFVYKKPFHNLLFLSNLIPLSDVQTSPLTSVVPPRPPSMGAGFRGEFLLVEDNKMNQKLMFKILSKLGVYPDLSENGQEAIQKVSQKTYDVIFMDLQMPQVGGIKATQQIRELEKQNARKPSYIVALTANISSSDRQDCLEVGMDEFLSKPIMVNQIKSVLEQIIC